LQISGDIDEFDFEQVTQELAGEPSSNWQVAYDEMLLERVGNTARFAFYFHYLRADQPILTSFGPAHVPRETPLPRHLEHLHYEPPG
jgi:hypothetical protein